MTLTPEVTPHGLGAQRKRTRPNQAFNTTQASVLDSHLYEKTKLTFEALMFADNVCNEGSCDSVKELVIF